MPDKMKKPFLYIFLIYLLGKQKNVFFQTSVTMFQSDKKKKKHVSIE